MLVSAGPGASGAWEQLVWLMLQDTWLLQGPRGPSEDRSRFPHIILSSGHPTAPLEHLLCARLGKQQTVRQGLHPGGTGPGKGSFHLFLQPILSSVALVPGAGCWGEDGEWDRCGPWPLRRHCLEQGTSKDTAITNQLREAG